MKSKLIYRFLLLFISLLKLLKRLLRVTLVTMFQDHRIFSLYLNFDLLVYGFRIGFLRKALGSLSS